GGNAVRSIDYDVAASGGGSYYDSNSGRLYVKNTQSVTLTFTPRNNTNWQDIRSITAQLQADGSEAIYGFNGSTSSQVWLFDDEPLLSLGQGAYQFVRVPYTTGSSTTLPIDNSSFNTASDILLFDSDGINDHDASFAARGLIDRFAIRWEPYIRIPTTGDYRFYTNTNAGVQLTVKRGNSTGELLGSSNHWNDSPPTTDGTYGTNNISLEPGDVVWLRFDYYENGGGATAQLYWQRPNGNGGIIDELIPASALFLSESVAGGRALQEPQSGEATGTAFTLFANQST
ncbi:MAG: PA14 domain-containing protein, partial [Cyanobacteriota bacterium]